ncbi:MAG: hypothetical protein RPV21_03165 [Candidatus Sedimenticola sp. (ex Thyasira tokunagai)]
MTSKDKNAPERAGSQGAIQTTSRTNYSKIRKGTKLYNVILHLVKGNHLHRFQAEKIVRDHVLPSTVAGFQREYGIPVAREMITVTGYAGSRVTVADYWFTDEARIAAAKLLEAA